MALVSSEGVESRTAFAGGCELSATFRDSAHLGQRHAVARKQVARAVTRACFVKECQLNGPPSRASSIAARQKGCGGHPWMVRRDSNAQHRRAAHKVQRRIKRRRLAVDPRMNRPGGADLERRCAPCSARTVAPLVRPVQHHDPEAAGVEPKTGPTCDGAVERIGIVRYQHDRRVRVLSSQIVNQVKRRRGGAGTQHFLCVSSSVRTFAPR
jgi:hypothetical protein